MISLTPAFTIQTLEMIAAQIFRKIALIVERIAIQKKDYLGSYSENSKGVDLFDQKISYYLENHKSGRWY